MEDRVTEITRESTYGTVYLLDVGGNLGEGTRCETAYDAGPQVSGLAIDL